LLVALNFTASNNKDYLRCEVFRAVTAKNAVFWDIKIKFVPHRKLYFSATVSIWGFHGGDNEKFCPLGCDAV
jgi:hypothetical protein